MPVEVLPDEQDSKARPEEVTAGKKAKKDKKEGKVKKARTNESATDAGKKESDSEYTHYVHLVNGNVVPVNEKDLTPEQVALALHTTGHTPYGHYVKSGKAYPILGIYRREEETKEESK